MSELTGRAPADGRCDECGHFRYADDLINGECWTCEKWAEDQIADLRTEVKGLKATETKAASVYETVAEIKRLAMQRSDGRITSATMLKTLHALCDSALRRIRDEEVCDDE